VNFLHGFFVYSASMGGKIKIKIAVSIIQREIACVVLCLYLTASYLYVTNAMEL
jgi:hypothetical protein